MIISGVMDIAQSPRYSLAISSIVLEGGFMWSGSLRVQKRALQVGYPHLSPLSYNLHTADQ